MLLCQAAKFPSVNTERSATLFLFSLSSLLLTLNHSAFGAYHRSLFKQGFVLECRNKINALPQLCAALGKRSLIINTRGGLEEIGGGKSHHIIKIRGKAHMTFIWRVCDV
jgi:hypothetical protein